MTRKQKTFAAIGLAAIALVVVIVTIFRSVGPAGDAAYSEQLHHLEATADPNGKPAPNEHPAPSRAATRVGGKAKFNGM